jgi:tRNA1(Val) A37 N6-methylase TrmN6
METGGFDVIIGNPPYVESSKVQGEYQISGFKTTKCGNLYAYFIERAIRIAANSGSFGMIVPVASVCTGRYEPLQHLLATYKSCNLKL